MDQTIKGALEEAEQKLAHVASARLDAEVILAFVMGCQRELLYREPNLQLGKNDYVNYQSLISRRVGLYPVAYLIGRKEFWSMDLEVNENTLVPRPETEVLIEVALKLIPDNTKMNVLDLGTGCGAIAIAIAKEKSRCQVTAVDVSKEALLVAERNAQSHNANAIHFLESDLFSGINGEQFDLILSNPPYVATDDPAFTEGEIRHEPRMALDGGLLGMDIINQLVPLAKNYLKGSAMLLIEHGYEQAESVRHLLVANQFTEVKTYQDYSRQDRVSVGRLM